MDNVDENTDADNILPIRLKKPGETASKQVLPEKSAISTAAIQNKQRSKAKPNKTPPITKQTKRPAKPTKKSKLIALLSRKKGCSIIELIKRLDWQAHTIRAAITRLRSEGFEIARTTSPGGKAIYQIAKSSDGVEVNR